MAEKSECQPLSDVPANQVAVAGKEVIVLSMRNHEPRENIEPIVNMFQLSHTIQELRSEFLTEIGDLKKKVEDLEGKLESVLKEVEGIKLAVGKPAFIQQDHESTHSFSMSDVRSVREDVESRLKGYDPRR